MPRKLILSASEGNVLFNMLHVCLVINMLFKVRNTRTRIVSTVYIRLKYCGEVCFITGGWSI